MDQIESETEQHQISSADSQSSSSSSSGRDDSSGVENSDGRIRYPGRDDVLCGRGRGIASHPGNVSFRKIVRKHKEKYLTAAIKDEKRNIANEIIAEVENSGSRFLVKDDTTTAARDGSGSGSGSDGRYHGYWVKAERSKAFGKTTQALREGASSMRRARCDEGGRADSVSNADLSKRAKEALRHFQRLRQVTQVAVGQPQPRPQPQPANTNYLPVVPEPSLSLSGQLNLQQPVVPVQQQQPVHAAQQLAAAFMAQQLHHAHATGAVQSISFPQPLQQQQIDQHHHPLLTQSLLSQHLAATCSSSQQVQQHAQPAALAVPFPVPPSVSVSDATSLNSRSHQSRQNNNVRSAGKPPRAVSEMASSTSARQSDSSSDDGRPSSVVSDMDSDPKSPRDDGEKQGKSSSATSSSSRPKGHISPSSSHKKKQSKRKRSAHADQQQLQKQTSSLSAGTEFSLGSEEAPSLSLVNSFQKKTIKRSPSDTSSGDDWSSNSSKPSVSDVVFPTQWTSSQDEAAAAHRRNREEVPSSSSQLNGGGPATNELLQKQTSLALSEVTSFSLGSAKKRKRRRQQSQQRGDSSSGDEEDWSSDSSKPVVSTSEGGRASSRDGSSSLSRPSSDSSDSGNNNKQTSGEMIHRHHHHHRSSGHKRFKQSDEDSISNSCNGDGDVSSGSSIRDFVDPFESSTTSSNSGSEKSDTS